MVVKKDPELSEGAKTATLHVPLLSLLLKDAFMLFSITVIPLLAVLKVLESNSSPRRAANSKSGRVCNEIPGWRISDKVRRRSGPKKAPLDVIWRCCKVSLIFAPMRCGSPYWSGLFCPSSMLSAGNARARTLGRPRCVQAAHLPTLLE